MTRPERRRSSGPARAVVLAVMAVITLPAPAVRADDLTPLAPDPKDGAESDPARITADILFAEGRELMRGGSLSLACPKFLEAYLLARMPGALVNLAYCHEQLGRYATAYSQYDEALQIARESAKENRASFIEGRMKELRPRVPRVVLRLARVPAGAQLLLVDRDVVIPITADETIVPLDPGQHRMLVRAPGHIPHSTSAVVREAETTPVDVPLLAPIEASPAAPDRRTSSAWDEVGAVAFVTGLAVLVTGAVTGIYAVAESEAASAAGCRGSTCPDADALARSDSATSAARATNVLLPTGAVLGGAGAVLFFAFD